MEKQLIEIADPHDITAAYVSQLTALLAASWARLVGVALNPKEAQAVLALALACGARAEIQPDGTNDADTVLNTVVFSNPDIVMGITTTGATGSLAAFAQALVNHFDIESIAPNGSKVYDTALSLAARMYDLINRATMATGTINLLVNPNTPVTPVVVVPPEQKGDVVPPKDTTTPGSLPVTPTTTKTTPTTVAPATFADGISLGGKVAIGVGVVGVVTSIALLLKMHAEKNKSL